MPQASVAAADQPVVEGDRIDREDPLHRHRAALAAGRRLPQLPGLGEHGRQGLRVQVALVDQQLGAARHGGDDARRRGRAGRPCTRLDGAARCSGGPSSRAPRRCRRRSAGPSASCRRARRGPRTRPGGAPRRRCRAPLRTRAPRPRAPGPARCAARGRRPAARASAADPISPTETPCAASASASVTPAASVRSRTAAGSSVPANAELPRRLRPKRAPSSSAQSTSATLRAGEPSDRSTSTAAITPSAPSSQPPEGTESMWEPTAITSSDAPATSAHRFPAASTVTSAGTSSTSSPQEGARGGPLVGPAHAPGPAGTARPAIQLAQVGDHARGVHAYPRRSGWARQWGPPPPMVNGHRSGS